MVKMRIPIREQLGALVILASLIGLAVISIATWVTTRAFVIDVRASRLALIASLKAAQLTSNLDLMQSHVRSAAGRLVIQYALQRYNNDGNNTDANWVRTREDLAAVFQGGGQNALLLQSKIFAKNATGVAGNNTTLIEATGSDILQQIQLPGTYENGSNIYLGDPSPEGYPPSLYPNFTYWTEQASETNVPVTVDGETMNVTESLLLGPWQVNEEFSLVSITVAVINNTSSSDVLGWLTVVLDGRLIEEVVNSLEGLGESGLTMLVGPNTATNRFLNGQLPVPEEDGVQGNVTVEFKLPPTDRADALARHENHVYGSANSPFLSDEFPAVELAYASTDPSTNGAGSLISTRNEQGLKVSVGYAKPINAFVDWVLLVEQSHSEVWGPINGLRNILLACIFGTLGGLLVLAFPVAHYSSRPIRRLRDATQRSVTPTGYGPNSSGSSTHSAGAGGLDGEDADIARKEGFFGALKKFTRRGEDVHERRETERRRAFRIPGKVKDRKHFIHDELTDLTTTFNEMSDELMMQYEKLEERVLQRTQELELSKKAAEAANESKTLFIANISHELKTPLNGIMGMCAVCMSEDDPIKLKRSLGIIYKSGDLLLNLLTDLLTFSKNQVGQHLSLDEKDFRLRDISSQILAIFERQAKDNGIELIVKFEGPIDANTDVLTGKVNEKRNLGPLGLGKLKDMILWGDKHRILQVLINLVSNSLKFTPRGGKVITTIRCVGDSHVTVSRHGSMQSRADSGRNSRNRSRLQSSSENSVMTPRVMDTANEINPMQKAGAYAHIIASERAASPPPGRMLAFEFEVEDSGPGIPDTLQQRIFEPFVQGDLGLSKKYGGTGLGLSICSQLASLLRGTIGLTSEMDKGSTFTMQIPLRHLTKRSDSTASSSIMSHTSRHNSIDQSNDQKPIQDDARSVHSFASANSTNAGPVPFKSDAQPRLVGLSTPFFASNKPLESPDSQQAAMARVTKEATHRNEKVKVLVAEDNKTNQEVVLRMLKLEDIYDVTVAKDGQEALDRVKESMESSKPYHLIFMDVQMPNVDGLESTRLIRKTGYSAPIVALTAYAEEQNVKECYASGMDYFLSKPIRRPQLKHVLKTYCPTIDEEDEASTPGPLPSESQGKLAQPVTDSKDATKVVQQDVGLAQPNGGPTNGVTEVTPAS